MLTPPQAGTRWDVIVVGAGHNGLTAGALLAKAGLSTLVLERRDVIGGACVTEEIAPGCRASTTSYIASMPRPEGFRTLEPAKHRAQFLFLSDSVSFSRGTRRRRGARALDGSAAAQSRDPALLSSGRPGL